jgi:hypothetical protein
MQIGLGSNEFKTLRGREWSKISPVLPVQKTSWATRVADARCLCYCWAVIAASLLRVINVLCAQVSQLPIITM